MRSTIQEVCQITVVGENLELLPRRAVFWPAKSVLVVTDLHLGKATTFRQNGIAIPEGSGDQDLWDLTRLINETRAKRCLILGDLFHSSYNTFWEKFLRWRDQVGDTEIELIKGNHDILEASDYHAAGLHIHNDNLKIPPFDFKHHPEGGSPEKAYYRMCGHLHPAVCMKGKGRQYSKLPCFYFGQTESVLPAFGLFTGTSVIQPEKDDRVFVALKDSVIPV